MKLLLFILLFLPLLLSSQVPKPMPDTYVNDYAGVLQEGEIHQLNELLAKLERETTVQLAILLIHELPESRSIEDFSREVGNSWKVGNFQNGLVYVAALDQRLHRLEVAHNLEERVTDVDAAQIIDGLKPLLRERQYFAAMWQLISDVGRQTGWTSEASQDNAVGPDSTRSMLLPVIQRSERPDADTGEDSEYQRERKRFNSYIPFIIGALVLGAVAFLIWAWRYRKRYREQHTVNGVYIGIGSAYFTSRYGSGDSGSSGGGFGGFGGSGGGGFSGGGASGSW